MRAEDVREDVELDEGWTPARRRPHFQSSLGRKPDNERRFSWGKFITLFILWSPVSLCLVMLLIRLTEKWARNGLNFYEVAAIICGIGLVFRYCRWLVGLAEE